MKWTLSVALKLATSSDDRSHLTYDEAKDVMAVPYSWNHHHYTAFESSASSETDSHEKALIKVMWVDSTSTDE